MHSKAHISTPPRSRTLLRSSPVEVSRDRNVVYNFETSASRRHGRVEANYSAALRMLDGILSCPIFKRLLRYDQVDIS